LGSVSAAVVVRGQLMGSSIARWESRGNPGLQRGKLRQGSVKQRARRWQRGDAWCLDFHAGAQQMPSRLVPKTNLWILLFAKNST